MQKLSTEGIPTPNIFAPTFLLDPSEQILMVDIPGQFHIQDTALISEFLDELPTGTEEFDSIHARWSELLNESTIEGHVIVISEEGAKQTEIFELAEQVVNVHSVNDVSKLAFVVPDDSYPRELDSLSHPNIDVRSADDVPDALQWIKR